MLSSSPDVMRLGRGFGKSFRPFAGMTRIRFKGSPPICGLSAPPRRSPRNTCNLGPPFRVSTRSSHGCAAARTCLAGGRPCAVDFKASDRDDFRFDRGRHGRTCSGHPRLCFGAALKTWMPATSAGMTIRLNLILLWLWDTGETAVDRNSKFHQFTAQSSLNNSSKAARCNRALPASGTYRRNACAVPR